MAILEGRSSQLEYDVSLILNAAASPGVIVAFDTTYYGSGEALGEEAGRGQVSASSSGVKPAGMLLAPMQNIDETTQIRNYHNDSHVVGQPVPLATRGYVVTNMIVGSPNPGDSAYLLSSGYYGPTMNADGGLVATPLVGQFKGKKNEAGYAKIFVDLP